MKKPSKTAAELEASIKVEMEGICDWPTDMMISVQPELLLLLLLLLLCQRNALSHFGYCFSAQVYSE